MQLETLIFISRSTGARNEILAAPVDSPHQGELEKSTCFRKSANSFVGNSNPNFVSPQLERGVGP